MSQVIISVRKWAKGYGPDGLSHRLVTYERRTVAERKDAKFPTFKIHRLDIASEYAI